MHGFGSANDSEPPLERKLHHRGHRRPRLVVIPRGDVAAVEVGPLETPKTADGASNVLLGEICGQLGTQKQGRACERAH